MFIVCRVVVAGGRTLVQDCIKEVDEGESFGSFYLANFYAHNYCLKEVSFIWLAKNNFTSYYFEGTPL
jgi:hypothetical protein